MPDPLTQALLDAWADLPACDRLALAATHPGLHDALRRLVAGSRVRLELD